MHTFVVQNLTKPPLSEDLNAWGSDTITNVVFLIKETLDNLTEPFSNTS